MVVGEKRAKVSTRSVSKNKPHEGTIMKNIPNNSEVSVEVFGEKEVENSVKFGKNEVVSRRKVGGNLGIKIKNIIVGATMGFASTAVALP